MSVVGGLSLLPFGPLRLSLREVVLSGSQLPQFSCLCRHEAVHSHEVPGSLAWQEPHWTCEQDAHRDRSWCDASRC